jgi:hypothetical protein
LTVKRAIADGLPLAQRRSGRVGNDAVCDADHAPQSANGLLSSFAVQGGDDLARKCYLTALDRDIDGVETNLPAKKTAYAVFQFIVRKDLLRDRCFLSFLTREHLSPSVSTVARNDASKDRQQRAPDESHSQLGRDGAGIESTCAHRGEQGNGLQKLRSETVADCAGDDVIQLLSKPAHYVGARRTGGGRECS